MTEFVEMKCGECGIGFMVPQFWQAERRETGAGFFCPNGHSRAYRETPAMVLQREINSLKQQQAKLIDERTAAERNAEEARGAALDAQQETKRIAAAKAKLEKRIAAGVCPDCHRTFTNMARHMTTKHPTKPALVCVGGKA